MPSVLLVTRTYPPDHAAVGQLTADLAGELARRGWRVGVATAAADPAGAHRPPPGGQVERAAAGVAFTRASHLRRMLAYLALYPALVRAARRLGRGWDVVVTTTDPPLQALLGPLLRRGGRLIHWSQDLYPELAEELGVLRRGGILARTLRALSRGAMRRCDGLTAPGRCMAERLRARGLPVEKITVAPNWSDAAPPAHLLPPDAAASSPARATLGLGPERFVAMYSGNLGLAHPFGAILGAAEILRARRPEITFAMVGEGPRLAEVRAAAAARGLDNMAFHPPRAWRDLPESLAAADAHLVTMWERLNGLVVPSKFYGVLAAGRPCLFAGPAGSEVARTITERDCGEVVGEEDALALAAALERLAADPALRRAQAENARRAAADFTLRAATGRLERAWGESGA